MSYEKIVIVTRKTRLEGLLERFNTMSQAKFYLERAGADYNAYRREHDQYHFVVDRVRRDCRHLAPRLHVIERGFLPTYLFTPKDLVLAIGQDGLVVNTAKYLDGQPLVAINPDPGHLMGVLLPYRPEQAAQAVARVMAGQESVRAVTMAEAVLSDGQRLLAFNDLFIGPKSHTSARYTLHYRDQHEVQWSSGVIVATGAGSTGWLSSVFNMAAGLAPAMGLRQPKVASPRFDWEEDRLRFAVREPYRSPTSGADLVYGELEPGVELRLESQMAEEGVIFSDGVEADFLQFNAGTTARIGLAAKKALLAVPSRRPTSGRARGLASSGSHL
jgi:NAD kinase